MRIALELAYANNVFVDIAREVLRALSVYRRGRQLRRRLRTRACGTAQDEFFYDKLHLPDGTQRADAHSLDRRADSAIRGARARRASCTAICRDCANGSSWFLEHRPDLAKLVSRWNEPGKGNSAAAVAVARTSHESAAAARARRKPSFSPITACGRCRACIATHPFVFDHNGDSFSVQVFAGRIGFARVRRQFELARAGVDAGQLSADRVAIRISSLLRRRVSRRVSDRLGTEVLAERDRRRTRAPRAPRSFSRTRTASVR